jgi:murein DD-endopeptidase MepM/ murein hydrolase activator NlpD
VRGRVWFAAVLFVAGVSASVAVSRGAADTTPTPTVSTTAATTTAATTTAATTTTTGSATAPVSTTAPTTTSAPPTTAVTTTTSAPKTAAHPPARRPRKCGTVAVAGLMLPRRTVRAIRIPGRSLRQHRLVFPAHGSVLAIGSAQLERRACGQVVLLRSVSFFRGAVTVEAVTVRIARGGRLATTVRGLRLHGRPVASSSGAVRLGGWGVLTLRRHGAALQVRLLKRRAGLPAGTSLLIAVAAAPAPSSSISFRHAAAHHRSAAPQDGPLKVTPPLGVRGYVFPVLGSPAVGDGYGDFRADVSGGWHHGDDIFAPLGTPVVAVASGTLNRVGWEVIGGWRLWVKDRRGNEFYYAHLSGYSPLALYRRRVRAGEVIGFVGNTGDAYTTPPHLHFEIHPHQFIWRAYNGAVDPTGYLARWRHVGGVRTPKPAVPAPPAGDPGREARYVFGELLAVRGFRHHAPTSAPKIRLAGHDRGVQPPPAAAVRHAAPAAAANATVPVSFVTLSAAFAVSILAGAVRLLRLRRNP